MDYSDKIGCIYHSIAGNYARIDRIYEHNKLLGPKANIHYNNNYNFFFNHFRRVGVGECGTARSRLDIEGIYLDGLCWSCLCTG